MPKVGFEPTRFDPHGPEPCASASSATTALPGGPGCDSPGGGGVNRGRQADSRVFQRGRTGKSRRRRHPGGRDSGHTPNRLPQRREDRAGRPESLENAGLGGWGMESNGGR